MSTDLPKLAEDLMRWSCEFDLAFSADRERAHILRSAAKALREKEVATDLDELEKLARAASKIWPGEWERVDRGVYADNAQVAYAGFSGGAGNRDVAAFIAAADPPTVLALIGRLKVAEGALI